MTRNLKVIYFLFVSNFCILCVAKASTLHFQIASRNTLLSHIKNNNREGGNMQISDKGYGETTYVDEVQL